jgi:hypothetical protein
MQDPPTIIGEFYFSSPFIINQRIYTYWVDGYSVSQTSSILQRKMSKKTTKEQERKSMESWRTSEEVYHKLISNQITSQFRYFEKIKSLLAEPSSFYSSPLVCNCIPSLRKMLLEKYFAFDPVVMREMARNLLQRFARNWMIFMRKQR